ARLVEPARGSGAHVAGEDAGGPLVVAGALRRVPWAGIAGAIIDHVQFGIIAYPAPGIAAADAPAVRVPAADAQVLAALGRVEGLERRADQDTLVRAGAVCLPHHGPRSGVESSQRAADAHLPAGGPDQYPPLRQQRSHGDRLAMVDLAELGFPDLAPC